MPTGILFVCLGNICRSPIAEGVLLHLARERHQSDRLRIQSAGTGGWHASEAPDPRAQAVARKHGLTLVSRAQQVNPAKHFDPSRGGFDWLIPMDRANRDDLLRLGAPPQRVRLLRSFDPALQGVAESKLDVPDPYSGSDQGFDIVYSMIHSACEGLFQHVFPQSR